MFGKGLQTLPGLAEKGEGCRDASLQPSRLLLPSNHLFRENVGIKAFTVVYILNEQEHILKLVYIALLPLLQLLPLAPTSLQPHHYRVKYQHLHNSLNLPSELPFFFIPSPKQPEVCTYLWFSRD